MKMAASFASTHCFLPLYQSRLAPTLHLQNNTTSSSTTIPLHLNRNSNSKPLSFSSSHAGRNGFNAFVESERKKDRLSSFAQTAAVRNLMGSVTNTQALRFAVVVARFNEIITKRLLEGALSTFNHYSVLEDNIDPGGWDCQVVWVPGSFEIGVAAERLGKSQKYHAILCIGAVIRGDTSHYDVVVNSAASGVLSAGLNSGVPCIFGVLTCDNMDQALNRAGGKSGNKGSETALTAIEMASLFEHHLK